MTSRPSTAAPILAALAIVLVLIGPLLLVLAYWWLQQQVVRAMFHAEPQPDERHESESPVNP